MKMAATRATGTKVAIKPDNDAGRGLWLLPWLPVVRTANWALITSSMAMDGVDERGEARDGNDWGSPRAYEGIGSSDYQLNAMRWRYSDFVKA